MVIAPALFEHPSAGDAILRGGGIYVVFAVWAVFGFAFPAEPLPLALNVISKILCFVAAIMLFASQADEATPSGAKA